MGFGNLGIALGAGVDEMNRQRVLDRADANAGLASAQNLRAQQSHDANMAEAAAKKAKELAAQKVWDEALPALNGDFDTRVGYLSQKYNNNNEHAGYNDGHTAIVERTPTGARAIFKKPDGTVARTQDFTPEQVQAELIHGVYGQLAGVDKSYADKFVSLIRRPAEIKEKREEKQLDYEAKSREAIALERVKGEERVKLQGAKTEGQIEVNAKKPAGLSSRGGGGSSRGDSSKGAKFDVDSDGNRVILYRDGTMVYPKDNNGAPVKIKAGTDLDQKYTRDLTKIYAGKDMVPPADPVGKARQLTEATKTGAQPDKFVVGKQYKDANGNVGTYAGNGQWK